MKRSIEIPHAAQLQQKYLSSFARGLWLMPKEKREDVAREVASHLEMMVAEGECAGKSALEATQDALRQFGRPAPVGRQIAWEWYKENFMKTPRFAGILGLVAVVLSSAWIVLLCSLLSRTLFPKGQMLIMGSEGAKMSVENGVLQVASGQAGVIGMNPLLITLALALPFVVVLGVALAGCVAMVRRQPIAS